MITLGGNVCVRNAFELDYCLDECVKSLLPVCDTVTVCDGESTDGTQGHIRDWMRTEPKLKLCVYPWPNPKGDPDFWVKWLNYCREHITADFQLQLDCDEVLDELSYKEILNLKKTLAPGLRRSFWCKRFNFWGDAGHTIPHGVCCSHRVVRFAPSNIWMPSDGPHPNGAECVGMAAESDISIFHYGFLREREAWFKKARALQGYFFNYYDPRLEKAESFPGHWTEMPGMVEWKTEPYEGGHPTVIWKWLDEHGF